MSTIINASTSSGLVQTADTSGVLVLQSNGTTQLTVSSTGTYGQLKSGTAQASTSGTSIDFTSIPSWVKRITVMFSGVSKNSGSAFLVQIGDSGGIENTGYLSSYSYCDTTVSTSNVTTGFGIHSSSGADVLTGTMQLCLVGSNLWVSSHTCKVASALTSFGAGNKTLSDTLDRVRITALNGTDTFDAGSINILYEG